MWRAVPSLGRQIVETGSVRRESGAGGRLVRTTAAPPPATRMSTRATGMPHRRPCRIREGFAAAVERVAFTAFRSASRRALAFAFPGWTALRWRERFSALIELPQCGHLLIAMADGQPSLGG